MKHTNYKRLLALAMTTTMVFGTSMVALAADNSGDSTGTGTSEGHVEEKHTTVTLPTDVAATTFAYTMDPEGLISKTSGAKYTDGTVFTDEAKAAGVYFLKGTSEITTTYALKEDATPTYIKDDGTVTDYTVKLKDGEKETTVAKYVSLGAFNNIADEEVKTAVKAALSLEDEATDVIYAVYADSDVSKTTAGGNEIWDSTSNELKVINKSSHDVKLTVKAEAVANNEETDIPLVAKSALASANVASLYLGLQVDVVTDANPIKAITKDTAAKIDFTISGSPGNFKIDAKSDKKGYEYRALTIAEYNKLHEGEANFTALDEEDNTVDLPWQETTFKLEGQTTTGKKITDSTTAPKVKVTWSWEDPSAAKAPSVVGGATQSVLEKGKDAAISVDLGSGSLAATKVESVIWKGNGQEMLENGITFDATTKTITIGTGSVNYLLNNASANKTYVVTFDDTNETSIEVTVAAKE